MSDLQPQPEELRGVIGVGASAGGLDALVKLFAAAPPRSGLAYVVVQHLSAEHKSLMPELLGRHTTMPVVRATDGSALEPDTVFLMPAQQDMTLTGGRLRLQARQGAGTHHPIDGFFTSLAAAHGSRAVGVVLSGTGRDGTHGVEAIHGAGGLVVAQDPRTAGFDGMPTSAIDTGVVDAVLDPAQIGPYVVEQLLGDTNENSTLREIVGRLSRASPIDFGQYKTPTLLRRVQRRVQELGLTGLPAYLDHVTSQPAELDRLAQEVLIGVSSFFRDGRPFELLEHLLPSLLAPGAAEPLRGWCIGCSTGQEAYSLAIVAAEVGRLGERPVRLKLFATDVDPLAVEKASTGLYADDLTTQVPADRLARYFDRVEGGRKISRDIRQMVVFSVHNSLRDPPFSRLDLVTCRNLLIYLQPHAQKTLLSRCALALKPGGLLLLGGSESLGDLAEAFEVVDARAKLYRRRAGGLRLDVFTTGALPAATRRSEPPEHRRVVDEAYRALARLDAPTSVVLNGQGAIVHTTGDVRAFFSIPVGTTTLDGVRWARGSLGTLLSAALARARREVATVEYRGIDLRLDDDDTARVDLRVVPLAEGLSAPHFLVSVRRVATPTEREDSSPSQVAVEQLDALQGELATTRENLQAAIEALETSNEELQATNEELLASNEELQATNEELQATNEELQATNEELFTANSESERRIDDLIELNADVDNLFRSTEIGTLFLDEHLSVRKFNPTLTAYTSLLDRDVGRPIAHVRHGLSNVDLGELARSALESGSSIDAPTTTGAGRHLLVRAAPYRVGTLIRGVLLNFVDVTELAHARTQLEGVMDALPEQIAVLDADGVVLRVNESWRSFGTQNGLSTGVSHVGTRYFDVLRHAGEPSARAAETGLRKVLSGDVGEFSLSYPCDAPTQKRMFVLHARALAEGGAVVSHMEITPVVEANERIEQAATQYRALFALTREPLMLVEVSNATVIEANPAAAQLFAQQPQTMVGTGVARWLETAPDTWSALLARASVAGVVEGVAVRAEGGRSFTASVHPVDAHRAVLRVGEVAQGRWLDDASRTRLNRTMKMEALGLLAGGVAHELNNVLTAILAVAYARRSDIAPDDPLAAELDTVLAACRRGGALTRNLLGFARTGSVARERVALDDVAREVVTLLVSSLSSSVTLDTICSGAPVVYGDRGQITQALTNLCANALDAVRGRGRVVVEAGVEDFPDHDGGRFAFLRVTDDGVGMDPATRDQAFEPFFTTKPRGEGTGLGLSMVYGVGKSHDGWVDLVSEPGRGTTATLAFPPAPAPQ
ncbi:MAG: chemotaxis protein CheB, partial [Myxococcota bacterium]